MGESPTISRRRLLQVSAAAALMQTPVSLLAQGSREFGVQLYTVRGLIGKQADATLREIAAIGYKELEVGRGDLAALMPIARAHGLRAVSTHIEAPFVTGNWAAWNDAVKVAKGYTLERALEEINGHGIRYAVVSYLMPGEREATAGYYEKLADQLNRAGELGRKAGVSVGYHNHGFEFEPLPDGRRPMDVLVSRTDPALVCIELDVFWVGITGANPVEVLNQYAKRVALVHLKDKARDAGRTTDERQVPPAAFKEVGSGALDFPAILSAAGKAGVQHYFVEQDHTPADPLVSLRKSYEYLKTVS